MGRYDNLHGDEDEIEAEQRELKQAYEDEHAEDYKYTEEWLGADFNETPA